jgi:hypothetical protein
MVRLLTACSPAWLLAVAVCLLPSASAQVASGPQVTLSPTSLTFGSQTVGTVSVPQVVTLTNTGDAALTITLIDSTPGATFHTFTTCGATVVPDDSCTIAVQFLPQTAGSTTGKVSVADNAAGSPQKVTLTGTGTIAGAATTPVSLNFGTIALGSTGASQTVTLTNQGLVVLTINSISSNSSDFPIVNSCASQLSPGSSCSVSVSFTPSSSGTRIGTLTVSDSDASSPQLVQLSGAATSGTASISPPSLAFGSEQVGTTTAAQTLTLTNSGSTAMGMVSVNASGDYAQTNTCKAAVAPGASCTISVTFTPSAAGTRAGFVTLSDTDATNLQTINLTGTGTIRASTVTVSPVTASVTFTQTQQFQAFLNGVLTTDVTWSVDGIVGGNARVGIISTAGLYTPPTTAGSHKILATSKSDTSQKARVLLVVTNMTGIFTQHNDNFRTGQNVQETVLTTGNVNVTQFGKLADYTVDGVNRGEPLYVPNVNIPGQGFHNVIYVADEHDSVYAFDADGRSTTPLWQVSFIDPDNGITTVPAVDVNLDCNDIGVEFGVTGTPVIDSATNRMFVVARTKQVSGDDISYHHFLHVLDIATGDDVAGSPVEITASVPGIGEGSEDGILPFDTLHENNRAALLESNGVVYAAFSSLCDVHPYHGWVIGYDANTLAQRYVYNSSPNGQAAGVWQSGGGISADVAGHIFLETSNGLNDLSSGGSEYGESVVKLGIDSGTLSVADYFTPFNATALTEVDDDLSSAGAILLPDQSVGPRHLMVTAGKEGVIYLLNRDNMGHFRATDDSQILQSITVDNTCPTEGVFWGLPAYYQNQVLEWPCGDSLHAFRLHNGLLSPSAISLSPGPIFYPPPTPSISANGNSNGIVWAIDENANSHSGPAVVHAYDAANVSRELWNSSQAAGHRDQASAASKGPVPAIANGKVYVATAVGVVVYGLLP